MTRRTPIVDASHQHQWKDAGKSPVVSAVVIILLTVVAYLPVMAGGFIWDDDAWTTGISALLRDVSGLRAMWCQPTALQQYYPLSGTTFWLDYHLWGFWPLPYHVENVLLHAASAVLFWQLLRRLEAPGAWLAGAVFALHPVMVESAGWITERKNVLSLVFYLGALLAYGRFNSFWKEDNGSRAQHRGAYALALLLCLGALLAKTTALSLPAVVVLIGWWKRGRIRWRDDVLPTLPMFALAIGSCWMTAWLEKTHVGAQGPDFALTFPQRCLIAGRVPWFYIGKLLWPVNLCFVYPRWHPDAGSWQQWLYPAATIGVLAALWLARRRMGRGPATAAFFYVGTLFPLLGFFNAFGMLYSFVWNHWVYLPSLGLIALAAALAARAAVVLRAPRLFHGVATVVLVALGTLTWRLGHMYRDVETLWRDTLAINPQSWLAHNNLGLALFEQGHTDDAVVHFQQALRIAPDYPETRLNLGNVFFRAGNIPAAIAQFQQAIATSPDYAQAHNNLGSALLQLGHAPEAIAQYQQALQINPNFAQAHNALALALLQTGHDLQAIRHFRLAIEIEPDFADAYSNLGSLLAKEGDLADAIDQFEQAVQLEPDSPALHHKLAIALLQAGRFHDAITHLTLTLRLNPNDADAHANLGVALSRLGRLPEAIDHFQQAVRLNPDSADAHYNLGMVLSQIGRVPEAIDHLKQALQINPHLLAAQNALIRLQSRP